MAAPTQYLARYAEPEAQVVAPRIGPQARFLTIPARDERADDLRSVWSEARVEGLCVCIVINGSAGDPEPVVRQNAEALAELSAGAAPIAPGIFLGACDGVTRLVVDRATGERRLPRRQGVGLARRIGLDIGCALARAGKLATPWLATSDADARLPAGYFAAADRVCGAVALAYPFAHAPSDDPASSRAHAIYELFLRYYVLALRHAGSPYAFHTVGSTLAVDLDAYEAVRGMPKRQAAEDFYLLNKLKKLGSVVTPEVAPIRLRARASARVPFGTGRATAAIVASGGYPVYHPAIFDALGAWLDALADEGAHVEARVASACARLDPPASGWLREAIQSLDLTGLARTLANAPPGQAPRRAAEWFDAFQTRKLVHALRDLGFGEVPWWEALRAPFCGLDLSPATSTAELFAACARLAELEREPRPTWPAGVGRRPRAPL